MIVRIMGEGQLNLADSHLPRLNELDNELLAAIEKHDEPAFHATLRVLLDAVRELGETLPDDSLEPSELILPSSEASLEEVKAMLHDDGLIPG
ncbi:hypothetical protein POF50_012620 [Streptomyces sp. SL13]|uniref:PspA-associated domain-containing protein n=1 Tax=Streptantibioticus silvisoli TaxID=2705255 RepID=A0AA90H3Q6_9ACTN|nr:hypothetical protein [Streptantibioticus silvisoli]MDI5963507.1 hypothetical protein [Streptantibioticus silvisoli]MDI5970174.1 hypothetical protein [Streptantibioticus silvisoli]